MYASNIPRQTGEQAGAGQEHILKEKKRTLRITKQQNIEERTVNVDDETQKQGFQSEILHIETDLNSLELPNRSIQKRNHNSPKGRQIEEVSVTKSNISQESVQRTNKNTNNTNEDLNDWSEENTTNLSDQGNIRTNDATKNDNVNDMIAPTTTFNTGTTVNQGSHS